MEASVVLVFSLGDLFVPTREVLTVCQFSGTNQVFYCEYGGWGLLRDRKFVAIIYPSENRAVDESRSVFSYITEKLGEDLYIWAPYSKLGDEWTLIRYQPPQPQYSPI